ncbi:MAG TPA: DUF721 domain-containing protein [Rhizomicrobium sp.]|nr:DUF721 domain-containing protein [Rhizomicrobium sp.]
MARTPSPEQQDPPPRRGRALPVAADAGHAAHAAFARMGFRDPTLVLRWNEIAGPEVARLAQPLKLSGDALTLRAAPGAALFLAHEKRALCERINLYLGQPAVSQIKFSQSAVAPLRPPKAAPQKPASPLPPTDPSRRYEGPDGLAKALQALARRR